MEMSSAERVYEDFEPSMEWSREAAADTLLVYLPGFRKEQLKVQVTSLGNLRIGGARQVDDNKWSRFQKEIPLASNYETNGVTARFEKGILYVKHPKIAKAPPTPQQPTTPVPRPQTRKPPQEKVQQPSTGAAKPLKPPQEKVKQPPAEVPSKTQKPPQEQVQQPPAEASKTQKQAQEKAPEPEKTAQVKPETQAVAPMPGKPPEERAKPPAEAPRAEPQADSLRKPSMNKQINGKTVDDAVIGKANSISQPTEKPSEKENEKEQEVKEKSIGQTAEAAGKVVKRATGTTAGEDENHGKTLQDRSIMGKEEAAIVRGAGRKSAKRNYREVFTGLLVKLKKPKSLMILILLCLAAVVLWIYAKNAISWFLTNSDDDN